MGIKEEAIGAIDNNKVYTSYFARACRILPDSRLVSISLGTPANFNGAFYRDLNPSAELLSAYKSGKISDTEYEEWYNQQILSKLNPEKVYNDLKGKVLLCYCGKDKFCHRHLVIKWLTESLGHSIQGGEI